MKTKLILVAILASAIFSSCKKEEVTPEANTTQNNQSVKKWTYRYDYKKTGDNTTYTSQSCLTEDEMLNIKQLLNAFNVIRLGEC